MMLNQAVIEAENILGIPRDRLPREGLRQFLLSKIDENGQIIERLKEKYDVIGYLQLEDKIRLGEVPGHPAWEDVILWEQLSIHTAKLRDLVKLIEDGDDAEYLKDSVR